MALANVLKCLQLPFNRKELLSAGADEHRMGIRHATGMTLSSPGVGNCVHGCALIFSVILCDRNLDEEVIIEVVKISRCGNQLNWIIRKT